MPPPLLALDAGLLSCRLCAAAPVLDERRRRGFVAEGRLISPWTRRTCSLAVLWEWCCRPLRRAVRCEGGGGGRGEDKRPGCARGVLMR